MKNTPFIILLRNNGDRSFHLYLQWKRHVQILLTKPRGLFSSFIYPEAVGSLYYRQVESKSNWKKRAMKTTDLCWIIGKEHSDVSKSRVCHLIQSVIYFIPTSRPKSFFMKNKNSPMWPWHSPEYWVSWRQGKNRQDCHLCTCSYTAHNCSPSWGTRWPLIKKAVQIRDPSVQNLLVLYI